MADLNQLPDYDYDVDQPGFGEDQNQMNQGYGQQGNYFQQSKPLMYSGINTSGFKDFLLKPELQRAIIECGFEHPSEVQQECIPQASMGVDILCQAKSGMGKTAVFVLTTLHQLDQEPKPLTVLVLCHTRELAHQIKKEYDRFTKYLDKVSCEVIYGGQPIQTHQKLLQDKPPTIIVGTPGRTLALVKSQHLKFENLKYFVLDECDKMLSELDMRQDVQSIFKMTPYQKQVMMFSATLGQDIRKVCKKFMKNPFEIYIDNDIKLTLHGLQQYTVKLAEDSKTKKLIELLDSLLFNQVIIFVKTSQRAEALSKLLLKQNFPSTFIHGGLPQDERIKRFQNFKEFKQRIMVATDLFGRGIDIEKINIVFNYDMPESSDQYLHRVARAGRFGTKGLAISFVTTKEDNEILEETQKRFEVKVGELPNSIDTSTYMNS
eukprot:403358218